jgi:hypothetical protein
MLEDLQVRTGYRALTHLGALLITPYTPKLNLRREKARNHKKARRQEAR